MSSEQHRAVLVILEGGIASGKTSLGTHLQDNYNFSFLKESYAECELLKKFFEGVNLDLIKIYVFQFQIWILSDHMNRMLKLKQMILEGSKKIVMDRGILSTIPFLDLYNKKEYLSDDVISALKLLVHALWKEFTIFCNTMNIKLVYVNLLCPIEIAWLRYLYRQ
jgi:deoxyadenosine/deoxycytidine kinase